MTATRQTPTGTLTVVGTGPGALDLMAPRARQALENAEVVVGYRTYLDLVQDCVCTVHPDRKSEEGKYREHTAPHDEGERFVACHLASPARDDVGRRPHQSRQHRLFHVHAMRWRTQFMRGLCTRCISRQCRLTVGCGAVAHTDKFRHVQSHL